jgi:hypothetical protein
MNKTIPVVIGFHLVSGSLAIATVQRQTKELKKFYTKLTGFGTVLTLVQSGVIVYSVVQVCKNK